MLFPEVFYFRTKVLSKDESTFEGTRTFVPSKVQYTLYVYVSAVRVHVLEVLRKYEYEMIEMALRRQNTSALSF